MISDFLITLARLATRLSDLSISTLVLCVLTPSTSAVFVLRFRQTYLFEYQICVLK